MHLTTCVGPNLKADYMLRVGQLRTSEMSARLQALVAAASGSCRAMGNLAYLYLNGISVRKDPARAVALYEKAIQGPSPDSDQISTTWRTATSLVSASRRTGRGQSDSTRNRRSSARAWRNRRCRG